MIVVCADQKSSHGLADLLEAAGDSDAKRAIYEGAAVGNAL